jgi:hypothetical protein
MPERFLLSSGGPMRRGCRNAPRQDKTSKRRKKIRGFCRGAERVSAKKEELAEVGQYARQDLNLRPAIYRYVSISSIVDI